MSKDLTITVEELEQIIKNELQDMLLDGCTVEASDVVKNNGVQKRAISVRLYNKNISAVFYMDNLYERYEKGEDIYEIIQDMFIVISENKDTKILKDLDGINNFTKVKSRIGFRLINKGLNKEFLKDVPHVSVCDLAVVFHVSVPGLDEEDDVVSSFVIKEPLMREWEMTPMDLMRVAINNSERIAPPVVRKMSDILKDLMGCDAPFRDAEDNCDMLVLSNDKSIYGAGVILYPGLLRNVATVLKSDLIIFPSSIHEVIVVPKSDYCDLDSYKEMVTAINSTEVSSQEVLSNNVYTYSSETGKLALA